MEANNNLLTDEQREAVQDPQRACIVTAGAGSGKTTLLVERYLETLKHASPHEILTLTFTKEAALQLKRRILLRAQQSDFSEKIIHTIEHTKNIGTIHSFCFSLIKNYLPVLSVYPLDSVIEESIFQQHFEKHYNACILKIDTLTLHSLLARWNLFELRELAHTLYLKRDDANLKSFELYTLFGPVLDQ
jgi:superfamily I DNA/RNA helicase